MKIIKINFIMKKDLEDYHLIQFINKNLLITKHIKSHKAKKIVSKNHQIINLKVLNNLKLRKTINILNLKIPKTFNQFHPAHKKNKINKMILIKKFLKKILKN